jgi:PASTA domain
MAHGKNCDKEKEKEKLKVKNLCVKNANVKNLKVCSEKVENSEIDNLNAKNIESEKIILDGKNLDCLFNNIRTVNTNFDKEVGGVPVKPEPVNPKVFLALLAEAEKFSETNRQIWEKGRERLDLLPAPDVDIYGYITVPIAFLNECGQGVKLVNSLAYDVEIVNPNVDLNDILLASVQINIGYINQFGNTKVDNLQIGNRQFQGSIDYDPDDLNESFGEKFNGTLNLNTNQINRIYKLMPDLNNQAALQLVLFGEKGLIIFEGGSGSSSSRSVQKKRAITNREITSRQMVEVPNLFGQTYDDAKDILEASSLEINFIPPEQREGTVVEQNPDPETFVEEGSLVTVILGDEGPGDSIASIILYSV